MLSSFLGQHFVFLSLASLISKFFESYVTIKVKIQTNQNAIDIEKYRKSVFTIVYILAIFLLGYVPYVCNLAVVNFMGYFDTKLARASMNACAVIVSSSSFVNPLLYYWRIKEIRDSVRRIVRNFCCKETEEES